MKFNLGMVFRLDAKDYIENRILLKKKKKKRIDKDLLNLFSLYRSRLKKISI